MEEDGGGACARYLGALGGPCSDGLINGRGSWRRSPHTQPCPRSYSGRSLEAECVHSLRPPRVTRTTKANTSVLHTLRGEESAPNPNGFARPLASSERSAHLRPRRSGSWADERAGGRPLECTSCVDVQRPPRTVASKTDEPLITPQVRRLLLSVPNRVEDGHPRSSGKLKRGSFRAVHSPLGRAAVRAALSQRPACGLRRCLMPVCAETGASRPNSIVSSHSQPS